MKMSVKVVGPV